MAARRKKGLCYNCDEPYIFGHKCKQKLAYMILPEDVDPHTLDPYLPNYSLCGPMPDDPIEKIQMSFNAASGEGGLTA